MILPEVVRDGGPHNAGGAKLIIALLEERNVLYRRIAQRILFAFPLFQFGDEWKVCDSLATQIQGILVAKLAIEVRDTRNTLQQVTFGLAASMYHLEKRTNQATMAIGRIGGDNLWSSNTEGNTLIFPIVSPETCACDEWITFFGSILDHTIIVGTHQGIIATHEATYFVCETLVRWLSLFRAKDD